MDHSSVTEPMRGLWQQLDSLAPAALPACTGALCGRISSDVHSAAGGSAAAIRTALRPFLIKGVEGGGEVFSLAPEFRRN